MLWVLKWTVWMRRYFEHSKHVFKVMDKKIIKILRWNILLNWPYAYTKVSMHVCLVFNVAYQQKLELCITSKMVHVNSQNDVLALYLIS